ncbi:MAG: DUF2255 family protein [Chloroflexi bacterium]|nr:MAG: DUF2255 family protein [Chloroflexota bacterium]
MEAEMSATTAEDPTTKGTDAAGRCMVRGSYRMKFNRGIWISTDGAHLYIRSGEGMKRQWPQNFLSSGEATLRMAGKSIKVKPRHVTDPDEARATSRIAREKYGSFIKPSKPGEPLTKGEQAVFELLPG